MSKENAHAQAGTRAAANDRTVRRDNTSPFPNLRVIAFRAVAFKSKVAELTIEVSGIGRFELDVFAPANKEPFVSPRSVRDRYARGEWKRTFQLDRAFAAEILLAIRPRLFRDELPVAGPEKPAQRPETAEMFRRGEAALEAELHRLEDTP